MKTTELYEKLIESIISATNVSNNEVDIVRDSIKNIKNIRFNNKIKIQAEFCHQKPYAFFIKPYKLFNKEKTELGDILFIVKYIDNNEIIDRRALFFQVKLSRNFNFKIEYHQFHFYNQIEDIEFKFGNIVYKSLNMRPIIWKNLSKPSQFGDYIFIGKDNVVDLYTTEIASQYSSANKTHFNYSSDYFLRYSCPFPYCSCLRFSPLFDFLSPNGKGNKIEGNFQKFIDLIYKRLNMKPDPPEENEGFWFGLEKDNSGFGVVEISIDNNG